MNNFTKTAIRRRLESDSLLRSLLAADPHPNAGGRPAIFNDWKADAPDALPQLLVRQSLDLDDDKVDQSKGRQGVWTEQWHFQAWAKTEGHVHQDIIESVIRLFHNQRFALDGGAILQYCKKTGGDPEGYDGDISEHFSIAIFELKYAV